MYKFKFVSNDLSKVSQVKSQQLDLAIKQANRDLGNSNIGVSIGVVTPKGARTKATGISNIEAQQSTETNDLFNIASVSKSYISAVVLKLQEQEILNLNDTIDKWLPNIAEQITNGDSLTIREILDGTGGLFDNYNSEEFFSDFATDYLSGSNRNWQPEDLIAYSFNKPPFSGENSTEQWTYTNTGNVIAALIVEEATGKPFEQILSEEILKPLGLKNTFFTSEDIDIDRRARGYADIFTAEGIGQDGILEDYSVVNTKIAYGAGSIVSSAEDVAIFFDSLAAGDLLSFESTSEIFNYVNTGFDSSRIQTDKFGLGVFPKKLPWDETRSMDGNLFGYRSRVDYFPSNNTTVSILINRSLTGNDFKTELVMEAYNASIANTLNFSNDSAISGAEADDYLTGTSSNDIVNGFEGNDIIISKKSPDALDGGRGNDLLEGGKGNDYLFGKEGHDNLYGGQNDDFLNGGVGNDLLEGGKGSDFVVGGDGRDTIDGGEGDDLMDGGMGSDLIKDTRGNNAFYGNDGDDLLFAGFGDDILYGDAGRDRIIANAGDDILFGGMGDDELNGGAGNDNLFGGEGNDTLTGLSGHNTLTGGNGSDRFILSLEGTNTIADFTVGEDAIALPKEISFEDLEIVRGQANKATNTFLNFQSKSLAILSEVDITTISQSDFVREFDENEIN